MLLNRDRVFPNVVRDILVWQIIVIILMSAGLLSILLGIPGTFIILGTALCYSVFTHFDIITIRLLLWLLGIAITGEIIESFLGLFAARKFGASRLALFTALIGSIAGAAVGSVVLPLVGTVAGAVIGAFLGTFLPELALKRGMRKSVSAGMGAFVGRTSAVFVKIFLGAIMIVLVILSFCRN
jgi:uncharacterized protein YqgC (DUF456 family)